MQLSGLAFLRFPASHAISADGKRGLILPLCWRAGQLKRSFTAFWYGAEAEAFYTTRITSLKAGQALHITAIDLHPHADAHGVDLHAKVLSCELAPERWPTAKS